MSREGLRLLPVCRLTLQTRLEYHLYVFLSRLNRFLKLILRKNNVAEREREFKLPDFFRLLRHRSAIVLGCTIILGVFLTMVALASHPVYEANGSIQITSQGTGLGLAGEFFTLGGQNPMINSEVEIIRSRGIALSVIDELDLRLTVTDVTHGGPLTKAIMFVLSDRLKRGLRELRMDDVVFPQESIDKSFFLTYTDDSGNFRVTGPSGNLGTGHLGEPFVTESLAFTVTSMTGPAGTRFELKPRSAFETLRSYREQLTVNTLGGATRTNLISVNYRDTSPSLASDVVNAIITEYNRRDTEWKAEMSESQTELIEDRLAESLRELQEAEDELEAYKNLTGVVSLPEEARLLVMDLSEREAERIDVELRLSLIRDIHTRLASAMEEDEFAIPPSLTGDQVIQQLAADHARLMVELENLLLDYTENHPLVIAKRRAIRQVRESILEAIGATINGLVEQRMDLTGVIGGLEQRLYAIPGVERDLLELQRRREVAEETYRLLNRRLDEAKFVEATFMTGNRIVDTAIPPARPVAPSIKLNLAMGLGLGLILGILIAFLTEVLDPRLRRVYQLEEFMDSAPLAVIQKSGSVVRAAGTIALAVLRSEKPVFTLVCPGDDNPATRKVLERVIDELSRGVKPVLLVDTSSGDIPEFFNAAPSPGVSEIAAGQDVNPQTVADGRIRILPAGAAPSVGHVTNPAVREKIAGIRQETALTLFYSPGFAHDPSMRGWAAMSAGAILVARRNFELRDDLLDTYDALTGDDIPIVAALFIE